MREQNGIWINGENASKYLRYIPSNADMIRAMTNEGLAEWFVEIQNDISKFYDSGHSIEPKLPTCEDGWIEWLKQGAWDERS